MMNRAIENFGWNGCISLAGTNEVIYYEVIFDKNNKFLPIEDGAWKFVLKVGGLYGFDTYTREKVDYKTIHNDITKVYKDYIIFDEDSSDFCEITKHLSVNKGLMNKKQILSKLQSVLKNDSGIFDEALKFINI